MGLNGIDHARGPAPSRCPPLGARGRGAPAGRGSTSVGPTVDSYGPPRIEKLSHPRPEEWPLMDAGVANRKTEVFAPGPSVHVCWLDSWGSTVGPTLVDPCPAAAPGLARLRLMGHRRAGGPRAFGSQWTPMDPSPTWIQPSWAPNQWNT